MSHDASNRRARGTGSLYVQQRANGREAWYGRWYLGDRRVNRCLGPKLRRGTGEGLNRTQAEAELRRLMVRERPPESVATISFASAAELMLRELDTLGRKATTLDNYQAMLRAHLLPAAMTGMRQGELLALRWRDVDWAAKRIRIRRNYTRGHWSTPKSRSGERSVPLSSRVAEELRVHQRRSRFSGEDDLVFANPLSGEVLPHSPLVQRFKKALKAAGVRKVRFHDLRHTFGTRMAASPEVSMRKIQEWMGHRDYRTTLIYAGYEPGDDESGMVDRAFG